MRAIPPEIYSRVQEQALAIVNASESGDGILEKCAYARLFAFYQEMLTAGETDPFLTETLADFADDPKEAIYFYQLAMRQARNYPDEPIYSKAISLGLLLAENGQMEQAKAHLRDGLRDAVKRDATSAVGEALKALKRIRHAERNGGKFAF